MGWRSTLNGSMWTGSNGLAEGATLMYKSAMFDLSWLQADDRTAGVLLSDLWAVATPASCDDQRRSERRCCEVCSPWRHRFTTENRL